MNPLVKKITNVWNMYRMSTMSNYHDLYLITDVLLLANIFEKFVNWSLKYYGLNPCHYFSSPGLSWDAMLKMTGIELELISDITMDCLLKKEWEEVLLTLPKDIVKQMINSWHIMTVVKKVYLLFI